MKWTNFMVNFFGFLILAWALIDCPWWSRALKQVKKWREKWEKLFSPKVLCTTHFKVSDKRHAQISLFAFSLYTLHNSPNSLHQIILIEKNTTFYNMRKIIFWLNISNYLWSIFTHHIHIPEIKWNWNSNQSI
jgi:hypothetical protein